MCHLLSRLAFQIKSPFLAPATHFLIYRPVVQQATQEDGLGNRPGVWQTRSKLAFNTILLLILSAGQTGAGLSLLVCGWLHGGEALESAGRTDRTLIGGDGGGGVEGG